ncbi:TetR/AcrR family transcriptional regulator [Gorillibacterium massiliense]|uniref:TetR/AcrR family transcriptional regulator n=1 Tax=Gorillibacterium massiliense TaxID=1280390 RepID=UPI0004AF414D|nr:TetR/AcrR family transcriptional regulator [Gorillibacterium massiliense]
MYTKFLNLDEDKKIRILNAAMKEFAAKGYERASTNEIVKEAEIAKGLLFHYFANKKQLYLFLYDYCIDVIIEDFYKKMDYSRTDFFDRLRQSMEIKFEIWEKYPDIFEYVKSSYLETASEVHGEMEEKRKVIMGESMPKILDGVDYSFFKEGIDLDKVYNIVMWSFEHYGMEMVKNARAMSELMDKSRIFPEVDAYIQLFKDAFYK